MSLFFSLKLKTKSTPFGRKLISARKFSKIFFERIIRFSCLTLIKLVKGDITLTYNPDEKPDGVGAQVQRILAIYGLSKHLDFKYAHTGIRDVAIHALDPYRSADEYFEFISSLNSLFKFEGEEIMQNKLEFTVGKLKWRYLVYFSILSIIKGRSILIRVSEPYAVTESMSCIYPHIYPLEKVLQEYLDLFKSRVPTIALHYRWGVGGKEIQKGESVTRELDLSYYLATVRDILKSNLSVIYKLVVVTDAPANSLVFKPPIDQRSLWVGSPGFNGDMSTVSVSGIDMIDLFSNLGIEVQVVSGGSPMEAIAILRNSEHLIMSRSSLSFVAGVLCAGHVYHPASFWHNPLPQWQVINDQGLIVK